MRIDQLSIKTAILQSSNSCLGYLSDLLPRLLRERTLKLRDWTTSSIRKLPMKVATVDDYVTQRYALTEINHSLNEKKSTFDTLNLLYILSKDSDLDLPKEDL